MTDTRPYAAYVDNSRKPLPIRELIEQAVEMFRATHPGQTAGTLLLHSSHLAELGTVIHAGGETWQGSYLDVIDPRAVRVGPLEGR